MTDLTAPNIVIEKNLLIRMRDGVRLATDVYRPAGSAPTPVLLTRVPYNKDLEWFHWIPIERACAAGYAVVIQDTRGRFASEGDYARPFIGDAPDGADTIAWITQQPWCDGQVGMFGLSAQGITQLMAASEGPAGLRAIAPMFCPPVIDGQQYQGGALRMGTFLEWAIGSAAMGEVQRRMLHGQATQAEFDALRQAAENTAYFSRTPLTDQPLAQQYAPYYFDWLEPQAESVAEAARAAIYGGVNLPALHIAGWYDLFVQDTLRSYQALRQKEKNGQAGPQRLIVGPWAHLEWPGVFPDHDYGPRGNTAGAGLVDTELRWFDQWLKGGPEAIAPDKRVRLFIMGPDVWRDEAEWPLPDTHYQNYYLRSQGQANTAGGDGALSTETAGDGPADTFTYDPHDPAPTTGGANMLMRDGPGGMPTLNAGPRDQRAVEQRPDVLCYTSAPLAQPLEVTGPIALVLSVSSSAPDTDFTGKLVDVYPTGYAEILTDGILRVRSQAGPLEPGQVVALRLDLGATAKVFQTGHRLRLEVSSSNFPRFDRNSNTGGAIAHESAADYRSAHNNVHHSAGQPSYLILPIIER